MAKWGEGDPRWIVEEREDAKNVNNWHWYAYLDFDLNMKTHVILGVVILFAMCLILTAKLC